MTEDIERICENCSIVDENGDTETHNHLQKFRIIAAPEYLRIRINQMAFDEEGVTYKNRNPLEIPDQLDITQYMTYSADANPVPVRYRLRNVVYHSGPLLEGGHYTAGVTRIRRDPSGANEFWCNDRIVSDFTRQAVHLDHGTNNMLTANPVDLSNEESSESEFDPSYLVYVRLPTASAGAKGSVVTAPVVVDRRSVAERIRGEKRKGRGKTGDEYRKEVC